MSGLPLDSQHQCLKDPFYFCAMSHEGNEAMKKYLDHAHSCKEPCSPDFYSLLQNLKDPFLQYLLLSGIHESLHNNSVDLTEIFKIVGNPKLDHSVLHKHEHKNGGNVMVKKNEDASNFLNLAADSETIPKLDPRTVGKRNDRNRMLGGFNVSTIATPAIGSQKVERNRMRGRNRVIGGFNGSQKVERQSMRSKNRVIGGFNVTDIGNDANALATIDEKNKNHAFPWMVRVFGPCGSM